MVHPTLAQNDILIAGDYRGELRAWIRENAPYESGRYVKEQAARFRLQEELSLCLAKRKGHGLGKLSMYEKILSCGKKGKGQKRKGSEEYRFRGCYCNLRSVHIPDAIRYRIQQGKDIRNQFIEIAKQNNLWGFYSWTFTLSEQIRTCIEEQDKETRKGFLQDCRRAVVRTFKACFGVSAKMRGKQPGFTINTHPFSSGNPFKQAYHFHLLGLPCLVTLKSKQTVELEKRFDHRTVKKLYKQNLDKVLDSWGLGHLKRDLYDVHLRDIESWEGAGVSHAFKYTNRSPAEDLMKSVKRVADDLSHAVCVLSDKKAEVFHVSTKTKEELLDAFERALNPVIQERMSYGFMRVLEKYSSALGITLEDFENDDSQWEESFNVDIHKIVKAFFLNGKPRSIVMALIRRAGTCEVQWIIPASELGGEQSGGGSRKLYKATRS